MLMARDSGCRCAAQGRAACKHFFRRRCVAGAYCTIRAHAEAGKEDKPGFWFWFFRKEGQVPVCLLTCLIAYRKPPYVEVYFPCLSLSSTLIRTSHRLLAQTKLPGSTYALYHVVGRGRDSHGL